MPFRSLVAATGTNVSVEEALISSAFPQVRHFPEVQDRKLRALAVTAATRSPALPDVPTLDELGIKNQEAETMQGELLPASTPKSIVDLLQTEIARMSPAAFAAYIKADVAKWKKVIADAKIPQIGG